MTFPKNMPQYQTDYIISWDSSAKDHTCVMVLQLRKEGTQLVADEIGRSFAASGCVSLRQLLKDYEDRKFEENLSKKAGRWEADHADYACSCCGTLFKDEIFYIRADAEHQLPKFCPNCGAFMAGNEKGALLYWREDEGGESDGTF